MDLRVHSAPETPKQTTMRILKFISEFELRDKKINKKLERDEEIQDELKQQDEELKEEIHV